MMHTTELHIFNDRLLMYHEYARKVHLLRFRAINVSALSNYVCTTSISGSFYSVNTDTIFESDPTSVNLYPIRIEFNPDFSASADTPLVKLIILH